MLAKTCLKVMQSVFAVKRCFSAKLKALLHFYLTLELSRLPITIISYLLESSQTVFKQPYNPSV
jgi:hypothetical protein